MTQLDTFDEMMARETFVELVAGGISPINAGIEVGWTPRQMRAKMKDNDFRELVEDAQQRLLGTVEETLVAVAKRGNVAAITLFLFNRAPDRWRDVKRIEIKNDLTISMGMVASVKQGALELLREQGVEAMQAINAPVEEDDVIEAEIVE